MRNRVVNWVNKNLNDELELPRGEVLFNDSNYDHSLKLYMSTEYVLVKIFSNQSKKEYDTHEKIVTGKTITEFKINLTKYFG